MNEPTTDKRDERIAELEADNKRLRDELAARDAEIAELRQALAQALKRIEELERRLGLDSQISSKPPSSDGPKHRAERPKKAKSKRKRGGQNGHKGHHRKLWPPEKVDHFNPRFPSHCSDCGLELSSKDAVGAPVRHQVFELVPKLIECTEYQLMACQCAGCGHTTRARLDESVSRSGWGARLVALLATLASMCRDSRRQLDWFVGEVVEAPSSLGCVQKHLEEAGQALEPGFHQARRAVEQAEFVGLDETGWRLGQLPYWIWVAEAQQAAIFLVREGRTKQVAQELVGAPKERIFTTDRYAAYGFLPAAARQICYAHLLREFHQMAQRDGPIGRIGEQLEWVCRELQREWAKVREGQRDRQNFVDWVRKKVRPRWERLLRRADRLGKAAPAVVRWLIDEEHIEVAWTFLDHDDSSRPTTAPSGHFEGRSSSASCRGARRAKKD
jgi:transposase